MRSIHPGRSAIACSIGTLLSINAWAHQDSAAALRARGLEHGYNLDYPEALAAFREAIAADPRDATAHSLAAATVWMSLLFEQGAVTVDDYLGQTRAHVARKAPRAELATAFRQYIDRAVALAEQRIRENPSDADAHFQLGAAAGFRASYIATIDGRVLDSVGASRRAYNEHKRSITADPRRRDAGLIVGMYRYGVSSLPLPLRLMARLAGFDAGRQEGLRLIEDASRYPSNVQTNALFTLVLIYNREGRHVEALRIIRQLQRRYPRNRLLWLEEGSTALRAARPAEALQALDEGLAQLSRDPRPRAYGEEARWRYQRGAALVALRDTEAADRELQAVLSADERRWVRGRTHLQLGKLADLAGNRHRAIATYRRAIEDCRADRDSTCSDEATRLVAAGYR